MTESQLSNHSIKINSLHCVCRTAWWKEIMERFFEGREENFSREQAADERNLNINLLHFLCQWLII